MEHPTEGPRTTAARLRPARFGGWVVSHGSVCRRAARRRLGRTRARLAAAEGGPLAERALLRTSRAVQAQHRQAGSDTPC